MEVFAEVFKEVRTRSTSVSKEMEPDDGKPEGFASEFFNINRIVRSYRPPWGDGRAPRGPEVYGTKVA
jgi:hypothetical protein